jgi:hypothetical protein
VRVVLALWIGGCTITRDVPPEQYACESGGPCDAGVTPPAKDSEPDAAPVDALPEDALPIDADAPDADAPDTGSALAACPKIQPLPGDGLVSGDTSSEVNTYESGCSAPGGPDVVYGFTTRARLRELTISTGGSSFDTAIHLYRDDCDPQRRVTCNDEQEDGRMPYSTTSFARLANVQPGNYAVVVDGFGSDESGAFVLRVAGKIAPGEPCDPAQTFLTCEIGTCSNFSCPEVLDCPDGVDADEDGTVDEDACTDPPTVNCTPPSMVFNESQIPLTATVFDEGGIEFREWRVMARPFGSFETPLDPVQEATFFFPDMAGSYRIRYRASDDQFQLSACEIAFTTEVQDKLRVELIWNGELLHHEHGSYLNLHLLHPNATRWFDPQLDCSSPNCLNVARDWGVADQQEDDPFLIGLRLGPQWAVVFAPQTNGTYGIGVEYEFDAYRGPTSVVVNVYCGGILEQMFGPVTLTNGNQFPTDNDFWKVAEVDIDATGCAAIIPYLDGAGGPSIVLGADAEANR